MRNKNECVEGQVAFNCLDTALHLLARSKQQARKHCTSYVTVVLSRTEFRKRCPNGRSINVVIWASRERLY